MDNGNLKASLIGIRKIEKLLDLFDQIIYFIFPTAGHISEVALEDSLS